jgi:cation diffusion facilitator CzcD-associated flavoprotein CzcO
MAFTDTLIAHTDAEVVLVDRRHRPGGHWLDAYPFVRLHQPSAYYGVESRDRSGTTGSTSTGRTPASTSVRMRPRSAPTTHVVLDEHLLQTGRVRFFGTSEYRGG